MPDKVALASPVTVFVPAPAPPPVQMLQLKGLVLFNFDKWDARNLRSQSLVQLQELVRQIEREKLLVQSIRLNGHADRLNSTGKGDYNLRLSEKRVETVKAELQGLGLPAGLISTQASGDTQPLPGCENGSVRAEKLRECLQPNRRVDVLIEARRP
jgi:outer membrane protein OmpA-like peptidoglycan-associated protein